MTLKILCILIVALFFIESSISAQNQWPPFTFFLSPTYEDGQITYTLNFASKLPHGGITDLRINIPLPDGLRYISGHAQDTTTVTFDGQEVQFFSAMLDKRALKTASFVVEVTDPDQTVFTIQPWLSWKGQQPGDFLSQEVTIDITKPSLVWEDRPASKRLMLELFGYTGDNDITYLIETSNLGGGRMWDVTIKLPIPAETVFVSAKAEPPFVATFDGREVTFKAFELEALKKLPPLQVKVSTKETMAKTVVTHAWAFWKNEGRRVTKSIEAQEDVRTGDLVIHPHAWERSVADSIGDTPINNYDITSISLQETENGFAAFFYTVGEIGPVGEPIFFVLDFHTDCVVSFQYRLVYNYQYNRVVLRRWNETTKTFDFVANLEGGLVGPRQIAVNVSYDLFPNPQRVKHFCGAATVVNKKWPNQEFFEKVPNTLSEPRLWLRYVDSEIVETIVTGGNNFWQGVLTWDPTPTPTPISVKTYEVNGIEIEVEEDEDDADGLASLEAYQPNRPTDSGEEEFLAKTEELLHQEGDTQSEVINSASAFVPPVSGETLQTAAEVTPTPSLADALTGKMAVPIDNGIGYYDIHIFSVLSGQQIGHIPNAHHPNFRYDGQRLLYSKEGDDRGVIYEYNLVDNSRKRVTDDIFNEHPFYDVWGNRVTYGNSLWAVGSPEFLRHPNFSYVREEDKLEISLPGPGNRVLRIPILVRVEADPRKPFIFVQCRLLRPSEEEEGPCQDIASRGKLVPAGWMGEIQGQFPVWAANDQIVFNGCNSWSGFSKCGIYSVSSTSTRGFSDGFIPTRLTEHSSDLPSDTKGELIAFNTQRDGDWEAYVMNLDGSAERNISQSPGSNDGLPTISPDGHWVAFVSDRSGRWAIWVVPANGEQAPIKLFDIPKEQPWGLDAERVWVTERISWGGTEHTEPLLWQPPPTPDYGALFVAPASTGTPIPTSTPQATPTPAGVN